MSMVACVSCSEYRRLVDLWTKIDSSETTVWCLMMQVRASKGAEGSGGGAPRQPWTAPLPPQPLLPIPRLVCYGMSWCELHSHDDWVWFAAQMAGR
jgi:hypothetical protein